jgi:beta-N-acetylhexosaminidase
MVNLASFGFNRWYFYHHTDLETEDHLIVGYRSQKEVMSLVKENKIAGVYVTHRNVKGKTPGQMREFVQELQRERLRHSQEKLVILADQEGGVVSHLSPPLTYTESLGEVYQKGGLSEVKKIAATHGRGLQELGVTVNLAPVADLQAKNSAGGYSQINRRAISDKPQVVQEVVEVYCQTLAEYEVKCTLKHFPGIGGVKADTHFELGEKRGEKSELVKEMEVFSGPGVESWVMVSHTKAPQLDIHKPSSLSSKALSKVEEVNPSATTITDDFSMLPISQGVGMNQAYRQSLEAGVDYVLVSYDKELMYRLR